MSSILRLACFRSLISNLGVAEARDILIFDFHLTPKIANQALLDAMRFRA